MAVGVIWTDKGQEFAIDQLDENTAIAAASFTYFGAWGSGSATPAIGDTTLTELAPARTAILAANMSQPATDTVRWVYILVAAGTINVQETGVFSALTSGNMHVRIVHGALNLESGDQVTYTINLRLKDTTEA